MSIKQLQISPKEMDVSPINHNQNTLNISKLKELADYPVQKRSRLFWTHLTSKFQLLVFQAGYAENIAAYLKMKSIDLDQDGVYTEQEISEKNEEAKDTVEGVLNLLVNFGVIGALIFSVLFSFTVSDVTISQQSMNFFGDTISHLFKYCFLACMNYCVMCSLLLIFWSVLNYKHLSFWMPNLHSQMLWIKENSIVTLVLIGQSVLVTAAVSIPFGSSVIISPWAGLISIIFLCLFFLMIRIAQITEDNSLIILHQELKRQMNKQHIQ